MAHDNRRRGNQKPPGVTALKWRYLGEGDSGPEQSPNAAVAPAPAQKIFQQNVFLAGTNTGCRRFASWHSRLRSDREGESTSVKEGVAAGLRPGRRASPRLLRHASRAALLPVLRRELCSPLKTLSPPPAPTVPPPPQPRSVSLTSTAMAVPKPMPKLALKSMRAAWPNSS